MIYLSTNEAAARWNIDVRMVQKYCSSGRVVGAVKRGRAWLIPSDATKPDDMRGSVVADKTNVYLHFLHPMFNLSFESGKAEEALGKLEEKQGQIATAWLRFYQGRMDALKECSACQEIRDVVTNLSFLMLEAVHALVFDENAVGAWRKISKRHQEMVKNVKNNVVYNELCGFVVAELSLILLQRDESLYPEWLRKGDFSKVPRSLKLSAYKSYSVMLFVQRRTDELRVFLCLLRELYRGTRCVLGEIYALLIGAANEIVSGNGDMACKLIAEAADRAIPDGIVFPFVEFHMLLGGYDNSIIKGRSDRFYRDVQSMQTRFRRNWSAIYINIYKGGFVSADLTEKEVAVILLCNVGLTNKNIAGCLDVSVNTIKYHMTNIMSKLGLSSRKQLQKIF